MRISCAVLVGVVLFAGCAAPADDVPDGSNTPTLAENPEPPMRMAPLTDGSVAVYTGTTAGNDVEETRLEFRSSSPSLRLDGQYVPAYAILADHTATFQSGYHKPDDWDKPAPIYWFGLDWPEPLALTGHEGTEVLLDEPSRYMLELNSELNWMALPLRDPWLLGFYPTLNLGFRDATVKLGSGAEIRQTLLDDHVTRIEYLNISGGLLLTVVADFDDAPVPKSMAVAFEPALHISDTPSRSWNVTRTAWLPGPGRQLELRAGAPAPLLLPAATARLRQVVTPLTGTQTLVPPFGAPIEGVHEEAAVDTFVRDRIWQAHEVPPPAESYMSAVRWCTGCTGLIGGTIDYTDPAATRFASWTFEAYNVPVSGEQTGVHGFVTEHRVGEQYVMESSSIGTYSGSAPSGYDAPRELDFVTVHDAFDAYSDLAGDVPLDFIWWNDWDSWRGGFQPRLHIGFACSYLAVPPGTLLLIDPVTGALTNAKVNSREGPFDRCSYSLPPA